MKITFITHRVPFPPNKGEKLRTFHQIEYLVKLGHTVSVYSPTETDQDELDAKQLAEKFSINVVTGRLNNRLFRLLKGLLTNRSFSETNFFSHELVTELSDLKTDAIIYTASSLINYLPSMKLATNVIRFMDCMDVDSDKWDQYANKSRWPTKLIYKREAKKIRQLEKQAAIECDQVFLIAETETNLFKQKCYSKSNNISVLGNGIDHTIFAPSTSLVESHEGIRYLFTGVMDYKPNVDAMLWFVKNCWPHVIDKHPQAKLVIAGMNPVPSILKLSQSSSIEVTGFVDDIMPYFQSAHIFIAPFLLARGVQNKVLQAMSCGLATVSTPMGAEGILANAGDNMILAETADDFTEACIVLANDSAQRDRLGGNARSTIINHYSWEQVLSPLSNLLSQGSGRD